MVEQLNFPPVEIKSRLQNGVEELWDPMRKKYLVAQPEEWVRQHWISFLNQHLGYPLSLGKTEVGLSYLSEKKRCDIIWYTSQGTPLVLVEVKRPGVKITQEVFNQIGVYNLHFKVPYLIVSNGIDHFFIEVDFSKREFKKWDRIPEWSELQ